MKIVKVLASAALLYTAAFGIQLEIRKDANASVSDEELSVLMRDFAQRGGKAFDADGVRKGILRNRKLANAYIEEYAPMAGAEKYFLTQHIEDIFAAELVSKIEKKAEVTDDMLHSYYESHKDEFMAPESYDLTVYAFNSFDDAAHFYHSTFKTHNAEEIRRYGTDLNATVTTFSKMGLGTLYTVLMEEKTIPALLPPQFSPKEKQFVVMDVTVVHQAEPLPFESVKTEVEKQLRALHVKNERKKIIENVLNGDSGDAH